MYHLKSRLLLGSALLLFCALLSAGASFPVAWAAQAKTSGAQTAAISCSSLPVISIGSAGSWVVNAQWELDTHYQIDRDFRNSPYNFYPFSDSGAYALLQDGQFGPKTENATKDFQYAHGLAVDGIIGPHTWHALGAC